MEERCEVTALHIIDEIEKTVKGKRDCIAKAFAAILAGGHILIEDVPGVGKTTLAMAFSRVLKLPYRRLQFTPDVLPSDVTGFSMYRKETGEFVYCPGPVMCNLFLADEINRTSPKTQSALLEVMEEGSVTVDGVTREVPKPFIVMATQNPKGSAGTQPLPESQLDRFMLCMSMGYPAEADEIAIAKGKSVKDGIGQLRQLLDIDGLQRMQRQAGEVYVQDTVYQYIVKLVSATRENGNIELGVSPRGTIAITKMAKAQAYLHGRDYVLPADVQEVFVDVTRHRIVLGSKARMARQTAENVLKEIVRTVTAPSIQKEKREYHA